MRLAAFLSSPDGDLYNWNRDGASPLRAGRYHSLVADPELPDELELTATLEDVVMGVGTGGSVATVGEMMGSADSTGSWRCGIGSVQEREAAAAASEAPGTRSMTTATSSHA